MPKGKGRLELNLIDVHGEPIRQKANIFLRHQTLSDDRVVRDVDGSKTIALTGLHQAPQGTYRIEIDAPSYHSVNQFREYPERQAGAEDVHAAGGQGPRGGHHVPTVCATR